MFGIHYNITIFANLLLIHYFYRGLIKNSLSVSRIYYKSTINYANILYKYFVFNILTNISRKDYLLGVITIKSRVYYEFTIFSRIHPEFTIYFATQLWIHSLFNKSSIYSANIIWNNYIFADWLCIPYLFHKFTMNSVSISRFFLEICYLFFEFTWNQISISRIRYLSRQNTMNSLSISRFHYDFTIYIADSLIREYTMNSLCIFYSSRIHYELTFNFAKTIWISYLLREITMNLLRTSR